MGGCAACSDSQRRTDQLLSQDALAHVGRSKSEYDKNKRVNTAITPNTEAETPVKQNKKVELALNEEGSFDSETTPRNEMVTMSLNLNDTEKTSEAQRIVKLKAAAKSGDFIPEEDEDEEDNSLSDLESDGNDGFGGNSSSISLNTTGSKGRNVLRCKSMKNWNVKELETHESDMREAFRRLSTSVSATVSQHESPKT